MDVLNAPFSTCSFVSGHKPIKKSKYRFSSAGQKRTVGPWLKMTNVPVIGKPKRMAGFRPLCSSIINKQSSFSKAIEPASLLSGVAFSTIWFVLLIGCCTIIQSGSCLPNSSATICVEALLHKIFAEVAVLRFYPVK